MKKIKYFLVNSYNRPFDFIYSIFVIVYCYFPWATFNFFRNKDLLEFQNFIQDKKGIEIGGPSKLFESNNLFPIYLPNIYLDNLNFNQNTIWEKNLEHEGEYIFSTNNKPGKQFVGEASDLNNIESEKYDFLVTSHFLEHTSNPLKCLREFSRILKKNGLILIIVPYKNFTFDRKRSYTTYEHLIKDYQENVLEDDLTHISEILENHDLIVDYNSGTYDKFMERCLKNNTYRGMHHHVFSVNLLEKSLEFSGFKILKSGVTPPYNMYAIAKKN